jgi:hypothetical protein
VIKSQIFRPGSNQPAVLLVLNQVFIAMYVFELMFRAKLSPVAVAHHMGSVIIAAVAVAYSYNWKHHPDATLEFILCYLWGTLFPLRPMVFTWLTFNLQGYLT